MFALQIAASCTLQQGKHQRLWCKTCPTLSFHVASPMNSLLYVCTLPLLSIAACGIAMVWRCFFFGGQVMLFFYKQFVCAKVSLGCFVILVIRLFWSWFKTFLLSPLIQVVSAFRKVSLCTVLLRGGCGSLLITDASHLHPHKVRKIPSAGNQSSPAAVRDAFGHTFPLHPLQNCNLHILWEILKQTIGRKCVSQESSLLIYQCFIVARCLNNSCCCSTYRWSQQWDYWVLWSWGDVWAQHIPLL